MERFSTAFENASTEVVNGIMSAGDRAYAIKACPPAHSEYECMIFFASSRRFCTIASGLFPVVSSIAIEREVSTIQRVFNGEVFFPETKIPTAKKIIPKNTEN